MRLPPLLRVVALGVCAVLATLAIVLVAPGCGRTSLEPEVLDGGGAPPAPPPTPRTCNAETCPTGCCDASGTCRTGTDVQACGGLGKACRDCIGNGFTTCDARKTCSRPGCEGCTGCCETFGTEPICHFGTEPDFCGKAGGACTDCAAEGRSCDVASGQCGLGKCDATTCDGCCVGDQCLAGTTDTACGTKGGSCQSCASNGQTCAAQGGGGGLCQGIASCGPANCGGCCVGSTCVSGTDAAACGKLGTACADCSTTGSVCVAPGQPNERTCQAPPACGPSNCPGCCVGSTCVVSTTAAACGAGGVACKACGSSETCNAGQCQPASSCGAQSCAGCCIGDICATGNQATACGVGGALCQNCAGQSKVCQGGSCQTPACGPTNCAGCCAGNICVIGTQDNACGGGGQACSDCTGTSQTCQNRACVAKCGPGNCLGCCTSTGVCALGFANSACGEGGSACVDCSAVGSTCNALVSPRVCNSQQTTCPAPYGSCPAGVTMPITPTLQGHCADIDLDALESACSTGPTSASCRAAFTVLSSTDAACASCLAPFAVPFASLTGLYRCVAPDATTQCRRAMGCAVDCIDTSCDACSAATEAQCRTQVTAQGGQCGSFVQQTTCAAVLLGRGDLCAPRTYGGNFGAWLRAVGDAYCGNGK